MSGSLIVLLLLVTRAALMESPVLPQDDRIDNECHNTYYTLPECLDHPDGYGCECGPGFHWNTKMCMSSAIDSRFEFTARDNDSARYTLLLGRAFPSLEEFTVAFWLNVSNPQHPGTVLSYKHGDTLNVMRFMSGPKLSFDIWGARQVTSSDLIPHELVHIAWSWSSKTGMWQLFKNGVREGQGTLQGPQKKIPSGGEFVLGQSSRADVTFNVTYALEGDLSHFNIWNFILPAKEVSQLTSSCTFQYCGNAVQWVEFRYGTRGAIKMRWPSGIFNPDTFECYSTKTARDTCDTSCSKRIGAQCNEEINENILWKRQPVSQNASTLCPGFHSFGEKDSNVTVVKRFATRSCLLGARENDGVWQDPYIDDCISEDLLELKKKFQLLNDGTLDQTKVLVMSERLLNHTEENTYVNPIDVATVIDLLTILVESQSQKPQTVLFNIQGKRYARAEEIYPTFNQTITFCELIGKIVNNLLKPKNELGWNATSPTGTEGDSLMQVMHRFAKVISRSLIYHVLDMRATVDAATITQFFDNIEFTIKTELAYVIKSLNFPSESDQTDRGVDRSAGYLRLSSNPIKITNATNDFSYTMAGISAFRYKNMARILPTHDVKSRSLNDWVNSPVMALYLHLADEDPPGGNLTQDINLFLPLLDTFNISNPACVSFVHKTPKRAWRWSTQHCEVRDYDGRSVSCSCPQPGVFAVTTDMYNENWDKGDKRPELMNFASYFGCAASATMCLLTCLVHIYLRTSSSTAALHRNLSVSIAFSQLTFMFGIDRYEKQLVCHVFAILFHYAFLTTYSWVMNEAFNLYILVTYSVHSQSELKDTGSMLRYYILGWVFPAVLVGAFVGAVDHYYATDMCWVAPDQLWLFIGPAVGCICITILVLIFMAKEHYENSYTQSEKTNKIIAIHMKGLWIQIILITVCWSFAIISIKIVDKILKYLYALFNCLQGAFFIVFNMLLHEEVRAVLKSRKKKKALQWQGFEMGGEDQSFDSYASNMLVQDGAEALGMEARPRTTARRKHRTRIEASSDEGSDHSDSEMISSV